MNEQIKNCQFVPLRGKWDINGNIVTYKSPHSEYGYKFGEILSDISMSNGIITARIKFIDEIKDASGRIIIRYSIINKDYIDVGINGYGKAYLIDHFNPQSIGWSALDVMGDSSQLINKEYKIKVSFIGNQVSLSIDGIPILHHTLKSQYKGKQFGFFAWGDQRIEFEIIEYKEIMPKAFVIMQYGEPFDSIYEHIIKPNCKKFNIDPLRADNIYKPGVILQDIIKEINLSEIIIAEITPVNANVYYELGYSHAINKTTILLAERGLQLPFDIRSYRVIFYDNSISGKEEVDRVLNKHLANILGEING